MGCGQLVYYKLLPWKSTLLKERCCGNFRTHASWVVRSAVGVDASGQWCQCQWRNEIIVSRWGHLAMRQTRYDIILHMTGTSPQMTIQLENILHSATRASASQTEPCTLRHSGSVWQADDSQEIATNYVGCAALVVGRGLWVVGCGSWGSFRYPPMPGYGYALHWLLPCKQPVLCPVRGHRHRLQKLYTTLHVHYS